MRLDYEQQQNIACAKLGWPVGSFKKKITELYADELRPLTEIKQMILAGCGFTFTERSMQRWIKQRGKNRTLGDSFRLAVRQNRVKWAFKNPLMKVRRKRLNPALRLAVFRRDDFRCVFCGATKNDDLLEVDHTIPLARGGLDTIENLRVLCHSCNVGKKLLDKER